MKGNFHNAFVTYGSISAVDLPVLNMDVDATTAIQGTHETMEDDKNDDEEIPESLPMIGSEIENQDDVSNVNHENDHDALGVGEDTDAGESQKEEIDDQYRNHKNRQQAVSQNLGVSNVTKRINKRLGFTER